jgi:hypothetical protein
VGSCDVKFPIKLEGLAYGHGDFASVCGCGRQARVPVLYSLPCRQGPCKVGSGRPGACRALLHKAWMTRVRCTLMLPHPMFSTSPSCSPA